LLGLIVARLNQKKFKTAMLVWFCLCARGYAETIDVKIGGERTEVVSSSYQKESSSTTSFSLIYGRQIMGRWSGFAEYRNTLDNTLSAGILGITYDSEDLRTKGGLISGDGTPEISKMPIWMARYHLGVGIFRLVDILKSNDRSLGSRNLVPVKASPVGVKLGVSLYRMLKESWAMSGGFSYALASAGNFGISTMSFNLGVMYNIY
jgi:hypothetical protein